jgi:hypothetical protein
MEGGDERAGEPDDVPQEIQLSGSRGAAGPRGLDTHFASAPLRLRRQQRRAAMRRRIAMERPMGAPV